MSKSRYRIPAIFIVAKIVLLTSGCGGGEVGPVSGIMGSGGTGVASLTSATDATLTANFREALGPTSKLYLAGDNVPIPPVTVSASETTSAAVFSGTTLQEIGVDEADLIKSDGAYVFSLEQATANDYARNVLRRQRLDEAATDAALVPVDSLKIPFSADVHGSGLYLDSEHLQLAAVGEGATGWGIYNAWFSPQSWGQGVTEVSLIDTTSPRQMQTRRKLRMTGQLIGSRRLGSTLYLVMRSYPQVAGLDPWWPTDKTAANQAVIDSLQASQLLPTLSIDGGATQPLVQASSCFTQENNATKSADIITIVGIDLASITHRHAARCFTGGTEAFYMSDKSLYLATTRTAYTYSGAFPVYSTQTTTDIHKFALDGLDIAYRGSGSVTGHLGFDQNRKSFRMGEYNDALRVITQTATTWGGWVALPVIAVSTPATTPATTIAPGTTALTATTSLPAESPGHLTILQESAGTLVVVGELPNAARPGPLGKPGEQLYASRFIRTRGYLVTYRLTDPFYVLDLSDPTDPKIASELQVSGYSDYLFPVTDNLLLGVGKEAIADGSAGDGRFAWYQGVKLALIDVSDPAHPRETARSVIGRRGTDATVLHDHHGIALQTVGDTVRVSLPVSLSETPSPWATGAVYDYFQFTRTELQKFEINLSGQSLSALPALASNLTGQRDISSDRSLLWNNQVHYYQNSTWRSALW
jgi:hypothetical protein